MLKCALAILGDVAFNVGGAYGRLVLQIRSVMQHGLFSSESFTAGHITTRPKGGGPTEAPSGAVEMVPFVTLTRNLTREREELVGDKERLQAQLDELHHAHKARQEELRLTRERLAERDSENARLTAAVAEAKRANEALVKEQGDLRAKHKAESLSLHRELEGFRAANLSAQKDLRKLRNDQASLDSLKKAFRGEALKKTTVIPRGRNAKVCVRGLI